MLPATVAMLPVGPVGVAARAAVRTPTPVPAAMRPATTVARPRRAGTARRRLCDCRNIWGSSWGCEDWSGEERAEAPVISAGTTAEPGRRGGQDVDGGLLRGGP